MTELKDFQPLLRDYSELRIHENREGNIGFLNGDCLNNRRSALRGVSARVFKDSAWGFASSAVIAEPEIEKLLATAARNAEYVGRKVGKKKLIAAQPLEFAEYHDFSTRNKRFSDAEIMDFLKEIDSYVSIHCPGIKKRSVGMNFLEMQKEIITSERAYSYSMIPRCFVTVTLGVEKDGEPIEHYKLSGGFGQFEDHFSKPESLYAGIDRQYEELLQKRDAVFARAGKFEVILAPELTGLLAHEAIGHTTEADLVMGGSIAGDYLGKQVGSPLVSLVDFANTAYGITCPQPIFADDEGIKAVDAQIIENGVLTGFMHNRESSSRYGMAPTGNARAYSFSDEPIIRMRNTAFLPGTSALEDMIASVEDGYYLIQRGSGQADATSEFMFGVLFGYEIKGGKIGRAIKETTISGVAFDLLKTVSMAGNDMQWSVQGMCGKKQPMPTAKAGPAFKCTVHIGGK